MAPPQFAPAAQGVDRQMATPALRVDLAAVAANWRALDRRTGPQVATAATVKAGAYGLGLAPVARTLADAGVRQFFVAIAEEGAQLRDILGPGPEIFVYSGHMAGDGERIAGADLIALINTPEQLARHLQATPQQPFGLQLDTGMNRLGMEPAEWASVAAEALARRPRLIMSHLACADTPDHPANARQLAAFRDMTEGCDVPRSLAATGGVLMDPAYHFDLTRPGVGLYGGAPFTDARPVAHVSIPVIQLRDVAPGESVGYGCTWTAQGPARIATLAAGYADGVFRLIGNRARLYHGATPCPLVGRVSMDLLTADITHLPEPPDSLDLLSVHQGIDAVAEAAETIGYEVLTALGHRYTRSYTGGGA